MVPFFEEAAPIALTIASQRGIRLPELEGPVPPGRVAEAILDCIRNPVAEVYIHAGTREFVQLAAAHGDEAERRMLPGALAERRVYERLRNDRVAR